MLALTPRERKVSFELKEKEFLTKAAKRCLKEEADAALHFLKEAQKSKKTSEQDDLIHEIRKSLKKVRAVLRLIRSEIGEAVYKNENTLIRDAGRKISKIRDSHVLVETLVGLGKENKEIKRVKAYKNIHDHLLRSRNAARHEIFLNPDVLKSVCSAICEFKVRVEKWKLPRNNWGSIQTNVRDIYKAGRKALKAAMKDPSVEKLHELRKQVKYLRHILEVFEPVWPALLKNVEKETHRLADLLGEDHDLAILKQTVLDQVKECDLGPQSRVLSRQIEPKRKALETKAISLAKRVYTDRPKEFVNQLKSYWAVWQAES